MHEFETVLYDKYLKEHVCEPGNHAPKNVKNKDLIPILAKDLRMIKHQITINCNLKIKKLLEKLKFSLISSKDSKMKKLQIIGYYYSKIKRLLKQGHKSLKFVNNFIKELKKNLYSRLIAETDLLKSLYWLKILKFVDLEGTDFEKKLLCNFTRGRWRI